MRQEKQYEAAVLTKISDTQHRCDYHVGYLEYDERSDVWYLDIDPDANLAGKRITIMPRISDPCEKLTEE